MDKIKLVYQTGHFPSEDDERATINEINAFNLHCVLKLVMDEAVRINGECWDKDSDKLDLEYDEFVSEDEDSDEDEYDI